MWAICITICTNLTKNFAKIMLLDFRFKTEREKMQNLSKILLALAFAFSAVAFGNANDSQSQQSVIDSLNKLPLQQYFRDFGLNYCIVEHKNNGDERADEILALLNAHHQVALTSQDKVKSNATIYTHIKDFLKRENLDVKGYKRGDALGALGFFAGCLRAYVSKEYKAFIDDEIRALCTKCTLPKDKYATLPPSNTNKFHDSTDGKVYKLKEFVLSECVGDIQLKSGKKSFDILNPYILYFYPKITDKMSSGSKKHFATLFDKAQGENAFAKCLSVYHSDELDAQIRAVVQKHSRK
ncbi:hypothetical protein ACWIUD_00360 [Helicobacter sp. 23-1044]